MTVATVVVRLDRLITSKRVHRYPLAGLVLGLAIEAISIVVGRLPFTRFGKPVAPDLAAHLTAGQIVAFGDRQRLYDFAYQYEVQQRLLGGSHPEYFQLFLPPPFVAYLYAPLASLPYVLSAAIWTILSILLIVGSIHLLWPLVPALHQFGYWFVSALVLSAWPVIDLIVGGQDSAVSLVLLAVGLRLLLARRDGIAGVVLGFGLFKPQILVLLPVLLLCQRRWRALAAFCVTGSVLTAVSVLLVGTNTIWSLITLFISGTYGSLIVSELGWKMESSVALVRAIFPAPVGFLVLPATIGIATAVGALFIGVARQATRTERSFQLLYALFILAGSIVNPHLFIYDCAVLAIPFLIVYNDAPDRPIVRVSITAVYVLMWFVYPAHAVLGDAPWPLSLIAAPWAVVPMAIVALFIRQRLLYGQEDPTTSPESVIPQPIVVPK